MLRRRPWAFPGRRLEARTPAVPASGLFLAGGGFAFGSLCLGPLGFSCRLLRLRLGGRLRLLLCRLLLLLAQLVGGDIPLGHLGGVNDEVDHLVLEERRAELGLGLRDRKSTRLNSSH